MLPTINSIVNNLLKQAQRLVNQKSLIRFIEIFKIVTVDNAYDSFHSRVMHNAIDWIKEP